MSGEQRPKDQNAERALDFLEAMSEAWAEKVGLQQMSLNISRSKDFEARAKAIYALAIQAHTEGLYTGRISHGK